MQSYGNLADRTGQQGGSPRRPDASADLRKIAKGNTNASIGTVR